MFTRSIPALVAAYLLGGFTALDIERWTATRNVVVGAGVIVLAVATWAVANTVRRHPLLERPQKVGTAELAPGQRAAVEALLVALGDAFPGERGDLERVVRETIESLAYGA